MGERIDMTRKQPGGQETRRYTYRATVSVSRPLVRRSTLSQGDPRAESLEKYARRQQEPVMMRRRVTMPHEAAQAFSPAPGAATTGADTPGSAHTGADGARGSRWADAGEQAAASAAPGLAGASAQPAAARWLLAQTAGLSGLAGRGGWRDWLRADQSHLSRTATQHRRDAEPEPDRNDPAHGHPGAEYLSAQPV